MKSLWALLTALLTAGSVQAIESFDCSGPNGHSAKVTLETFNGLPLLTFEEEIIAGTPSVIKGIPVESTIGNGFKAYDLGKKSLTINGSKIEADSFVKMKCSKQ